MSPVPLLIAVDNWRLREAFAIFFKLHEGLEVVGTAASRLEAQNLCKQLNPEILLLEAELARQNPVDFIELLHRECPAVKIVVFASHIDGLTEHLALQAGAASFIGAHAFVSDILEVILKLPQQH